MVEPTNLKPRLARSFEMRSDSSVLAGRAPLGQSLTIGSPSTKAHR